MKKLNLPKTDSIQELAEYWDTHDLTDHEAELEDVPDPAFVRVAPISLKLEQRETKAIEELAASRGVSREELIRAWVREKLALRET